MTFDSTEHTANTLVDMYGTGFGGKATGRYRIARKLVCDLMGRRRLYAEDIQALARAVLERGFVLIDMESFFVVLSANAFVNYRRANRESIPDAPRPGVTENGSEAE
ncbi:hypothetical protein R5H32_07905 [Defluviimonas sp. D31]|nr:hypothetical protein [Defluviimonas sp. D31]